MKVESIFLALVASINGLRAERVKASHGARAGGAGVFHDSPHECDGAKCHFLHTEALNQNDYQVHVSAKSVGTMDFVQVSWDVSGSIQAKDWIGVFCVGNDNVTYAGDSEYIDWIYASSGPSHRFGPLVNMRCQYQFAYYAAVGTSTYAKKAASEQVVLREGPNQPTQVHLAVTETASEMRVRWASAQGKRPTVRYGQSANALDKIAPGTGDSYAAADMCGAPATKVGGANYRDVGVLLNAVMTGLSPSATYFYQVGDADLDVWSKVASFNTPPLPGTPSTLDFIVYGDLLTTSPDGEGKFTQSLLGHIADQLENDKRYSYTSLVHVGDVSYARGTGYVWEQFHAYTQPIAQRLSYMIEIGNHDYAYPALNTNEGKDPSGEHFRAGPAGIAGNDGGGECGVPISKRFTMPNTGNGVFWYSYKMGLTKHIVLSSEHDYGSASKMTLWLTNELATVDRSETPWVFIYTHRPMYTSENYVGDYLFSLTLRDAYEDLFIQHRVDIVFSGHYHAYERTCPVYNDQCRYIQEGTTKKAGAPVHIMVGSAGAWLDDTDYYPVDWRESGQLDFGFSRVHVKSATEMQVEFFNNRQNKVTDDYTIISTHDWNVTLEKHNHNTYPRFPSAC